jgi:hypothetical protein
MVVVHQYSFRNIMFVIFKRIYLYMNMGKAYKNFWSLNTDEAVVAGILRYETGKDIEVFMPLNAQMKGIDLVLINQKNKKIVSVQVKGSRAYDPNKSQIKKYGEGSAGWFYFSKDVIDKAIADYFIFLVYVIDVSLKEGRRVITPHTITIPTKKLKELVNKNKKLSKNRYNFFLWVNPKEKIVFDFRQKDKIYHFSDFLDKSGFELLRNKLK